MNHSKQGDSSEELLYFNRKEPPADPVSALATIGRDYLGVLKDRKETQKRREGKTQIH